ncbi:hypothetical protein ACHQM5_030325 [Ranunculus cassubicifolius]
MDGFSSKRANGRFGMAGRGSGLAFREVSHHDDPSVHCNRLVCSNRLNFMRSPQAGNSDKDKSPSSLRTSGKSIAGSSSRVYSAVPNDKKASLKLKDPSSHKGTPPAETNTIQLENLSTDSSSSNAKVQKQSFRQSGHGNQSALWSSARHSVGPRNNGQASKIASNAQGFNVSLSSTSSSSSSASSSSVPHSNRYGLRNLGCTSISDVHPPDSSHSGREEIMKRRNSDGEASSSAKGKTMNTSSSGKSGSRKNTFAGRNLTLSERPSQPTSRRTKYWLPTRNGPSSVRTRRTINDDNSTARTDSPLVIPQLLQNDTSVGESSSSSSSQESVFQALGQNSCIQLSGRNENGRRNSLSHPRDEYRHYNGGGIAEVLLALERIEQDEELTYEQLLILETNLFLTGLGGFRDQHRDMRLDIDNMSYEDLLALGDKMGTVSTGLTEEQLSNCLKKDIYTPTIGCTGDNIKCSICQEEYGEGDEVGRLHCDHQYHVGCVNQWLQIKNWCPICKVHAAPPGS